MLSITSVHSSSVNGMQDKIILYMFVSCHQNGG